MSASSRRLAFWNCVFYPSIRRITPRAGDDKRIFLTFDDGPDPVSTPAVLDCLRELEAPATFFLIAQKLRLFPDLTRRLLADGHAIGNHSLDHRYREFFTSNRSITNWVRASEQIFREEGIEPVGFRPPAGVRTPKLHRALDALDVPLVLWNARFFDTQWPWTRDRAEKSLARLVPGAIVLLHDRQPRERLEVFLDTLGFFVRGARERGYRFERLSRDLCAEEKARTFPSCDHF